MIGGRPDSDHPLLLNGEEEPKPQKNNERWYYLGGGVILTFALCAIIYFAALKDDCSDSSEPAPPPWNPADYINVDDYYAQDNMTKHGFTVNDNMRVDRLSNHVLSPDGRAIVFTRRQFQLPDSKTSTSTIHVLQLSKDESWITLSSSHTATQVTRPEWGIFDSSPQWTSDGSAIVFLSNRAADGSQQVFYLSYSNQTSWLPSSGNYLTPIQLTSYPLDVDNFLINPTNDVMAFSAQVYPGMTMEETVQQKQNISAAGGNSLEFTKLFVRHWDTWRDGTRNQPHLVPIKLGDGKISLEGTPVNVLSPSATKITDADAPTKPYGGVEEWSWSPNGRNFVFTRRYDETSMVAFSTNLDLFLIQITSATEPITFSDPKPLTASNIATDTQPAFSPNGTMIAYLAMAVPEYESDRYRIRVVDLDGNILANITEDWTLSVGAIAWDPQGQYLWGEVLENGENRLYKIAFDGVKNNPIIDMGAASAAQQTSDGYVLYIYQTWEAPSNVWAATLDGITRHSLTHYNYELLNKVYTSEGRPFTFTGSDGAQVQGWIWEPAQRQPGQKYPLAFLIHGGPQGAWEEGWSYRWNPQVYVGAGWGAVAINFHGSSGYGQAFTDSIQGHYGDKPFMDLMLGLNYSIQTYDWINGSAVAALGASYGGYMINWIAGQVQYNSAFRVLVCHDGMFDIRAFYYSTEELWFPEHDMPGVPWLNPDNFEQWNPATPSLVAQWHLPMLIIHGGTDYRITEAQGIGAFTACQRQGIPSKFLYFPKENHWVLNARNQIKWHETVLDWISTYTQ